MISTNELTAKTRESELLIKIRAFKIQAKEDLTSGLPMAAWDYTPLQEAWGILSIFCVKTSVVSLEPL